MRERGSCGDANALHADEIERVRWLTLDLQAEPNRFAGALHELIKGARLSVAAPQGGDRRHVVAVCIALNDYVESRSMAIAYTSLA